MNKLTLVVCYTEILLTKSHEANISSVGGSVCCPGRFHYLHKM